MKTPRRVGHVTLTSRRMYYGDVSKGNEWAARQDVATAIRDLDLNPYGSIYCHTSWRSDGRPVWRRYGSYHLGCCYFTPRQWAIVRRWTLGKANK